ncbi:hypothetical protein L1987_68964 [Smallanthus sonchifolius]|uniref:Uncharacterized protein n=1 Tax=Smallanthus sonchifolius TaxID=185202 RepID=A0ACB9B581_9ASTR|nr:hypothetical protein L1987_68964 [Smallanthus sonchifolius]
MLFFLVWFADCSRFGTWPVAMLAQGKNTSTLEGPVCNGSQHHLMGPKEMERKPTSTLIRQLGTIKEGFQETTFIEQLVETTFESQMEATNLGCSKIMNWHLHLEAHELGYPTGWLLQKNLDAVLPIK